MSVVPGYTAGVSPALLSTASSLSAAILHHGLGSQRAVRRETPVSPACSPPKRRGDSHPSGKRTWISFTCGLEAPKRHDLVSLAPPSSMRPIFIRFHVWHRHRASQLPMSVDSGISPSVILLRPTRRVALHKRVAGQPEIQVLRCAD